MNGVPIGFFERSRGIKKGDPLSLFLSIIMVESLGRALRSTQERWFIKGVKITGGLLALTHQQFVDDAMLFREGRKRDSL